MMPIWHHRRLVPLPKGWVCEAFWSSARCERRSHPHPQKSSSGNLQAANSLQPCRYMLQQEQEDLKPKAGVTRFLETLKTQQSSMRLSLPKQRQHGPAVRARLQWPDIGREIHTSILRISGGCGFPHGSTCEQRRRYDQGEAEDHMSWSTTACLGKLQ